MIFDILEARLVESGLVKEGETLFRSFMPAEVSVGVMTRAPLTGIVVDPFIEGWHKTEIQVITRHTDPVDGMKLATEVSRVLTFEGKRIFEATAERGRAQLNLFYPMSLPVQFPRLEGNGLEFSQHFQAAFGIVPAWR